MRKAWIIAALIGLVVTADVDAATRLRTLTSPEQDDLETLEALRRAAERKSDQSRMDARQVASEIESLRRQIVDMSRKQGVSEQRAAIYRAGLETLNQQESDITRRLTAARGKESRLLSALQLFSRHPPPTIFVSTRRATDGVRAAIIIRAVTPELQARTRALADENARLVRIRRESALQNEALIISENDVTRQREKIEDLIRQKAGLEDQLLQQADRFEAEAVQYAARQSRLRGGAPLAAITGQPNTFTLEAPVVGEKARAFNAPNPDGSPQGARSRGVTWTAQPGSQVTSPAEGEIEFAGPVEGFGQVVIINVGRNYRTVITGLGRLYVDKGQTVARHEPLGRMPNLSQRRTELYLELRQGETPVNPDTRITRPRP